jgi:predicted ATPase
VRDEEVETGTELRRMIDATMRARLCERVAVQSLSRSDCDQLVRAMLPGARARSELLQQIYARSRGNPLFIEELVRELHQSSELTVTTGHGLESSWVPSRVPARVRYLATTRLAQVDETMRRVLALAAAASATEISLSELRTGAATLEPAISDTALLDALDGALRKRILEERNSGYAFRHPLFRSALYQDLPRHRRDQLRAALSGRLRRAPEDWNPSPSSRPATMMGADRPFVTPPI